MYTHTINILQIHSSDSNYYGLLPRRPPPIRKKFLFALSWVGRADDGVFDFGGPANVISPVLGELGVFKWTSGGCEPTTNTSSRPPKASERW